MKNKSTISSQLNLMHHKLVKLGTCHTSRYRYSKYKKAHNRVDEVKGSTIGSKTIQIKPEWNRKYYKYECHVGQDDNIMVTDRRRTEYIE